MAVTSKAISTREISWAKPRYGRTEVAKFLTELSEEMQIELAKTSEFTANGDRVVVEARNRGSVRSTSRIYEHDWVMAFTVRGGEIVTHRHYYDTADILVASHGA